jgi:hypothetical protein
MNKTLIIIIFNIDKGTRSTCWCGQPLEPGVYAVKVISNLSDKEKTEMLEWHKKQFVITFFFLPYFFSPFLLFYSSF